MGVPGKGRDGGGVRRLERFAECPGDCSTLKRRRTQSQDALETEAVHTATRAATRGPTGLTGALVCLSVPSLSSSESLAES